MEAEDDTELEYLQAEAEAAPDTAPEATPIGSGSFCTLPRAASHRALDAHENLALRL
jgi:hypothetical protein